MPQIINNLVHSAADIQSEPIYYRMPNFCGLTKFYLKLEGLNIAGSIKLKTAKGLITSLEQQKLLIPGKHSIIESSSGNLGVALSIVCKEHGYPFTCVVDPNLSSHNETLMRLYGANIVKITQPDENGGYLNTRIRYVTAALVADSNLVWTNQYANEANSLIHYNTTAQEIYQSFPQLKFLFIGAGTTGTLMGCAKFYKQHCSQVKIIAVDAVGSVTFGGKSGKRKIPGLGTSRRPELVDTDYIDEILWIKERETLAMAHWVLKHHTLCLGGSSATVLCGVKAYAKNIIKEDEVVAIAPDFGTAYLDTIYSPSWIEQHFPVKPEELIDEYTV